FIGAEVPPPNRHLPVEVPLGKRDGLPAPCVANCDNLRTVNRDALVERISMLAASRQVEIKRAVGYAFGWEELIGFSGRARRSGGRRGAGGAGRQSRGTRLWFGRLCR